MLVKLVRPLLNFLSLLIFLFISSGCGDISVQLTGIPSSNHTIAKISGKSLAQSTDVGLPNTVTCTVPTAELYQLDSQGEIPATPLQTTPLGAGQTYEFTNVPSPVDNLSQSSIVFLVRINFCDRYFSRPLTGETSQDVSVGSTLLEIANTTQASGARRLSSAASSTVGALVSSFEAHTSNNLKDSFDEITAPAIRTQMQTAFNVSALSSIRDLTPASELDISVPSPLNEGTTANFTVTGWHWYHLGNLAFDWRWNSTVDGHTTAYSRLLDKNSQGSRVLSVWTGLDDGSTAVDPSKFILQKEVTLTIANTFPAVVPVLTVTSADNTNSRSVTLNLATGNTATDRVNCETFSTMALTENDILAPMSASAYTLTCDTDQNQAIATTLASTGDGLKYLRLWARDSSGNISAAPETVSVFLDTQSPVVSITNMGAIPGGSIQNVSFSVSDLPSGNMDTVKLYYSANGTTYTFVDDVSISPYVWTAPSSVDISTARLRIVATDKAGNSSMATTAAFSILSTLPVTPAVTLLSADPTNSLVTSIGITCDAGYAKVLINESSTAPSPSSGTWIDCATPLAYTLTSTGDGSKTVYVWAKDIAGNVSLPGSVSLDLDRTAPTISIDPLAGPYLGGSTQTISWTSSDTHAATNPVALHYSVDGTTWTSIASSRAATGTYSWTVPAIDSGTLRVRASVADTPGNTNSATTAQFIIDSTAPSLAASQLSINSGVSPAVSNFVRVNFRLTDNFSANAFCLKYDDTTAPTANDACWELVTSTLAGSKTPAATVDITSYLFAVGFVPDTYTIYVWAKDHVGLISTLSSSGAGTLARDRSPILYDPGSPPNITSLDVMNKTNPSSPPVPADLSLPAGSDTYIRWTANSPTSTLPTDAVSLFYRLDGATTWTPIAPAQGISNAAHGCVADDPGTSALVETGCYYWPSGSPSSSPYQIQIQVKNANGQISISTSGIVNGIPVRTLAGNTDPGLVGSAKAAVYFPEGVSEDTITNQTAVAPNGNVYIADSRGVFRIKSSDGMNKLFLTNTGTLSGLGGPASATTLDKVYAINMDYSGNLLVRTATAILKVPTTVDDPTVTLLVGLGLQNTGGVLATDYLFNRSASFTTGTPYNFPTLIALPNGDIYFNDSTTKLRYLEAATGMVQEVPFSGTGAYSSTANLATVQKFNFGMAFDKHTSEITYLTFSIYDGGKPLARVNPTTFASLGGSGPFPSSTTLPSPYYSHLYGFRTGMDGKLYYVNRTHGLVARYDETLNRFDYIAGKFNVTLNDGENGDCEDGTLATSCPMVPQDIFVSSNGTVYIYDNGRVRTIQRNGNIYTLYGGSPGSGDGGSALAARLIGATILSGSADGSLQLIQNNVNVIREVSPAGLINKIAGTGARGEINTGIDATVSPLYGSMDFLEPTGIATDYATGDVFMADYYGIYRLVRTTGRWVRVVGGGSNGLGSAAADGQIGTAINATLANVSSPNGNMANSRVFAFKNNILFYAFRAREAGTSREYSAIKTYDSADSYRQSHFAGARTFGTAACTNGGTSLDCSAVPQPGNRSQAVPNYNGTGVYMTPNSGNSVVSLISGNYSAFAVSVNITSGGGASAYRRITAPSTDEILYYCNGTNIVAYSLTNSTSSLLNWPSTDIKCTGQTMHFDSGTNKLFFFYKQNNITALGEYQL